MRQPLRCCGVEQCTGNWTGVPPDYKQRLQSYMLNEMAKPLSQKIKSFQCGLEKCNRILSPNFGVKDLSIQIVMHISGANVAFLLQKTCMSLATIAAVGHSTKCDPSLARDLKSASYPNKNVPLPRTPAPLSLQLEAAGFPPRPHPGSC